MTEGLNPLDIFFLVLIFILAVRCASKGLIAEVMAMAAVILGVICGVIFSGIVAALITQYLGYSPWNIAIAFLTTFLITYLIVRMVREGLYNFLEGIKLEKLDNVLGFFLGIIEGILIVTIIILLLTNQSFIDIDKLIENSIVCRLILSVLPVGSSKSHFESLFDFQNEILLKTVKKTVLCSSVYGILNIKCCIHTLYSENCCDETEILNNTGKTIDV